MIHIVMSCYVPDDVPERAEYAIETAGSLDAYLHSDQDHVLICADDGSRDLSYFNKLKQAITFPCVLTQVQRKGIGGSLNNVISRLRKDADPSDLIMYTTDDWRMNEYLHLDQAVSLINGVGYDYVRLGPLHPNLYCKTKFNENFGWWLELNQVLGGFCFATRPFICTQQFFEKVGPFLENANAYNTEQDYCERVAKLSGLKLASIIDNFSIIWEHIGEKEVGRINPSLAVV